jgi:hypothetical protein
MLLSASASRTPMALERLKAKRIVDRRSDK